MRKRKLHPVVKEALAVLPEDVRNDVSENCTFVMVKGGQFILEPGENLIVLAVANLCVHIVLHEIAHYVLRHRSSTDYGEKQRKERAAQSQANRWLYDAAARP